MAKKRFQVTLPPWHEKRLILWAYAKGTTKTQLAQNTLQARVEANADQINEMIQSLANDMKVDPEVLERQILEEAGFELESINPDVEVI